MIIFNLIFPGKKFPKKIKLSTNDSIEFFVGNIQTHYPMINEELHTINSQSDHGFQFEDDQNGMFHFSS